MNLEKILSKLISYPTISEKSNRELADFIIDFLKVYKIKAEKIEGDRGRFNVFSMIGPKNEGGIVLSGHTDVVPVEGQNWSFNPFKMTKISDRLYGRGASDMKGFIAVVLKLMKKLKIKKMK